MSCSSGDPLPEIVKEKEEYSPGPPFSPNSPFNDANDPTPSQTSKVYYGGELQQISLGYNHACLLFNDQKLKCWGDNASRQLGKMGNKDDNAPASVGEPAEDFLVDSYDENDDPVYLDNVIQVSAGKNSTCALLATNKVKCWGSGQLGFGEIANNQELPQYVHKASNNIDPLQDIVKIVSGEKFFCALTKRGTVKCWGEGSLGQLGNGIKTDMNSPVNVLQSANIQLSGVVNVAAGINHACAIMKDSKLKCWGKGFHGKLGNGEADDQLYPVYALKGSDDSCTDDNTSPLSGVVQVALSKNSTCALLSNKKVACWGKGSEGQLGNKQTVSSDTYVNKCALANVLTGEDSYLENVKKIVAGSEHFCALLKKLQVKCWGEGSDGRLGNGASNNTFIAEEVSSLTKVMHIAAGYNQVCTTKRIDYVNNGNARSLDCWGGIVTSTSPTTVVADLDSYNVHFYCNSSAICKTNPASLFAFSLTSSDGTEDHPLQILNLNEGDRVSIHQDSSCSQEKIIEGTVSTDQTSLNLSLSSSDLEPARYHYYAKVGNLCSTQFTTLIVE